MGKQECERVACAEDTYRTQTLDMPHQQSLKRPCNPQRDGNDSVRHPVYLRLSLHVWGPNTLCPLQKLVLTF